MRRLGVLHAVALLVGGFVCQLAMVACAGEGNGLKEPHDAIRWRTNYGDAMQEAKQTGKSMLIYFYDPTDTVFNEYFEDTLIADPPIARLVRQYIPTRLPRNATVTSDGQRIRLLSHESFREMLGRPGLAVVEFANRKSRHYGYVVSVYPFVGGEQVTDGHLTALLTLPEGSLTQRTLIFAVRTHPERPGSTEGQFSSVLAEESEQHARHQATINLQGHHNWDYRFHRINSRLPSSMGAQEVVAESWPGQGLFAAAREVVHSWRQSSGHWGAVRSRHAWFGYDMKRGRNGVWYATGIFARR